MVLDLVIRRSLVLHCQVSRAGLSCPKLTGLGLQAGGMHGPFLQKLLRDSNPPQVLIKTLLMLSQLARIARTGNEVMPGNYELIHQADVYSHLRKLFSHPDSGVRLRLCSLIGVQLFLPRPTPHKTVCAALRRVCLYGRRWSCAEFFHHHGLC